MSTQKPLIALAAGGTGGHVFPAEALASVLLDRGYRLALITDKRGAAYGGTLGKLETFRISAGGIAGRGKLSALRSALELGLGLIQARSILGRIRPAAVIGFGGYASVPGMGAAALAGIPTAIHEQNAVLGRANRLLAGHVRRIATSFAEVSHVEPKLAPKLVHTGMPVRAAILASRDASYAGITAEGPIELLVLGGSQGARILSEVIPAALARLPEALRTRIRIAQQCRPEDLEGVRRAYDGTGIDATLDSFFADVPERLARAHLVIARAGASTVAELTTLGRPAILVPYPFAVDDHQTANAHAAEDCGGAWLMQQDSFTADSLAARLDSLFTHPEALVRTAVCARNVGRPDAAEALADLVVGLIPNESGA
ncbi:undecaprenyldiphospho-muramoylpentapeptide beta-N-acetylglucosaminyltransferase [Paramagnetospirillum magneticum]|uniref:UDP-N-acetylglucosamine--N-acetylmuramyl-(pentapeptide) pyrophosphoryl-undecaprenol N-acetylglucosamine transferase n=1 Tax=Paramagnetospirillum magneticum (strain ATCC 700264 / AMB-1) TaxID=342108 RepID=MURG_PARM1|nr:undecaprenyldiphospho-muramoylpentapeptide beta-N-acetylglucosaminyltransferase [Paramagnetospirillum magneticum]Q2W0H3.1 RecName: Full=UDP-N-acetylglucosamine--N-acetylmuramyl-(pentapeptide) pyrophosphoryl-undecaprenol N-acetylglucosamine transferase; AltName: Full=Undecaprenyl-PP-MurNAc-pentapeptide-UDPGlcNAc GlcNAc transferase [Paramagnetospirillum magneticum AMB-1]BAE52652.1 UDP-N-acetylglucosamine:LPS N-acetylglucosamine transferase [Paramagnetospirillum magneticum AMB-1]